MKFFNRVTLQTPESVELEFILAGIGNRVYAWLIDFIAWSLSLIGFQIAWTIVAAQLIDVIGNLVGGNKQVELWFRAFQLLIVFFIEVGYFVLFETLWQGQTPGKRFVKIRVIRDDGRPIRLQQATLRALLRPIDIYFFCLGLFLIVFTKREKRLGDIVAGTLVVQEEQAVTSTKLTVSQEAQNLATQLLIEGDFARMLPEDFAVIREYLQRRVTMLPEARGELSRQLAHQLKDILALETVPKGVTANQFLEAVYLAYQQQSSS